MILKKKIGFDIVPTNREKSKMTIEEVIADINRLDPTGGVKKVFTEGYCYDFAYMLQRIFGGDIVYNMTGHYLLHVNGSFYDVTGKVDHKYDFVVENHI